jgi:hypothetical protein
VFSYQGQVIAVTDGSYQAPETGKTSYQPDLPDLPAPGRTMTAVGARTSVVGWAIVAAALLLGLLAASIVCGVVAAVIYRTQRDKSRAMQ